MSVSIEDALQEYLAANGIVAALVGERIYPRRAPQHASYPNVVYQTIDDVEELGLKAAGGVPVARLQLNCWARGNDAYTAAKAVRKALRDALHGYRGLMGTHFVQCAKLVNSRDAEEQAEIGAEAGVEGVIVDLVVAYEEAAPSF